LIGDRFQQGFYMAQNVTHTAIQNGAPRPSPPVAESAAPASALADENRLLREQLEYLLAQAARNHDIMCRHQAFDLEIVGTGSFPELITSIFQTLPVISELDVVTLTLLDEDADIHTVMRNLGVNFDEFPNLMFVNSEADLGALRVPTPNLMTFSHKPALGPFDPALHSPMFPEVLTIPASIAIVPLLRNKRLIGSLNLGSLDDSRFSASLGTDFIEHMASIIAICLENVISNELLKYIGLTDSLTGVYNRRYVDRRLLEEIARARRQGYKLSCMYIDIDYFKQVNDSVGHLGGDDVLREVAARIKAELRQSDALGRFGGEEFVALLIDAELGSAVVVAERIRASIADLPFPINTGVTLDVTVSIGVATLTETDRSEPIETMAQQLIAKADHALYEAKESGRNRVISFE
jgi:diguanylate cyclase (GGDEF)-like protein